MLCLRWSRHRWLSEPDQKASPPSWNSNLSSRARSTAKGSLGAAPERSGAPGIPNRSSRFPHLTSPAAGSSRRNPPAARRGEPGPAADPPPQGRAPPKPAGAGESAGTQPAPAAPGTGSQGAAGPSSGRASRGPRPAHPSRNIRRLVRIHRPRHREHRLNFLLCPLAE